VARVAAEEWAGITLWWDWLTQWPVVSGEWSVGRGGFFALVD
jgi:hypothetical protein